MSSVMSTTSVLDGNVPIKTPVAQGKVVFTQEKLVDPKLHGSFGERQGNIEIYSFGDGFVQVPTEVLSPSSFLCNTLGMEADDMLVSPNFGLAKYDYYKPENNLKAEMRSGIYFEIEGRKYWETGEDSVRFWMLRCPEFVKELIQQGWMHFPKVEEVGKEEKKELAEEVGKSFFNSMCKRAVPLGNLVKLIDRPDSPCKRQANDLGEIVGQSCVQADKAVFAYETGREYGDQLLYMPVSHPEGELRLILSGIGKFSVIQDSICNKFEPLERIVPVSVSFNGQTSDMSCMGFPEWWTYGTDSRVNSLVGEYAKEKKFNIRPHGFVEGEVIGLHISSRVYKKNSESNLSTREVIEQAADLRNFAKRAVGIEFREHEETYQASLRSRRNELGLPEPQV